ncbi:hypothetical protein D7X32_35495 [Corallococcus carmarthensis]|uniref:Uncharacterized protein n=2 Tax=Corallococcus carmarthensis TaxID=2316728 RepID=A0A3A8K271_9BACT|nr:hypothetical protein D7X32_35495 [Corallococcus carmarthensis]
MTIRMNNVNKSDGFQYHAAPVIAKDGRDRITNEIFGDPAGVGTTHHDQPTRINKYTVGDSADSFHGQWKDSFDKGPVTVALKPKSDIDPTKIF